MKEAIEYLKYKEIVKNKEINAYLEKGNANLGQLGFTDHSQAHCVQVAHQAGKFWSDLDIQNMKWNLSKLQGICMISGMPLTERTMQSTGHFSQTIC